jgi:hypothetical protein
MTETALWTVVTPTMGRESLLHLKQVLREESVPYVHLVMMDSKKEENALSAEEIEDDRTFVYDIKHPLYPKPRARMDVYLRAIGIMMARTKYIRCCDDDVWPEAGHLSRVTEFMERNSLDYTWCLRRMLTRDREVLGIDRFEAIGEINRFGYHLLDNSSLFYNQKAAMILAQVFLMNPVYGDDRLTWEPLLRYCKGKFFNAVLTNHMAQPNLTEFFRQNCSPE